MSLAERVEFEYERFKTIKICASRDSLYSSTYEIEVKKNILNYFTKKNRAFSEEQEAALADTPNILERIYTAMQERHLYTENDVEKCLAGLIAEKRN